MALELIAAIEIGYNNQDIPVPDRSPDCEHTVIDYRSFSVSECLGLQYMWFR